MSNIGRFDTNALDDPNLGAHEKLALLERLRKRAQDAATRMEQHGLVDESHIHSTSNKQNNWSDSDQDDDEEDELILALRFKARQQEQAHPSHHQRDPPPPHQVKSSMGSMQVEDNSVRQREPGPTVPCELDSEDEADGMDGSLMRVEPSEWYDKQSGERVQSAAQRHDQTLLEQSVTNAQRQKERKRAQQAGKEWKDKLLMLSNRGQAIEREVAALLRKPHHAASGNEHVPLERAAKLLQRKRIDEKAALAHQTSRAKTAVALLRVHLGKPGSGELYLNKAKELAHGAENVIDNTRDKFSISYTELKQDERQMSAEVTQLTKVVFDMETERIERQKHLKQGERLEDNAKSRATNRFGAVSRVAMAWKRDGSKEDQDSNNYIFNSDGGDDDTSVVSRSSVLNVDEQIAKMGGSTGGWDDRDHATFLQLLTRFKLGNVRDLSDASSETRGRFMRKVVAVLPMKDQDKVSSHLEWYVQFQLLLIEKKSLVKRWRAHRGNAVTKARENTNQVWGDDGENQRSANNMNPDNHRALDGGMSVASLKSQASTLSAVKREREMQRKAVEEWKAKKESDAREKREQEQAEQHAQAERDLTDKLRRARTKEILAIRKLQSASNPSSPSHAKSSNDTSSNKSNPAPTKEQLMARQQRDREIALKRRRDKLRAVRPSRQQIIQRQVVQNAPVATRDPNRLVKPTRARQGQAVTDEEVVEGQTRRRNGRAHDAVVASTAGAAKAGRGYSIGVVQGAVGGRAMASWRSVR